MDDDSDDTPPRALPRAVGQPPKRRTQPEAVPQQFVIEEVTGVHDGDDLRAARARRPTPERIGRLEDKHDKLDEKVDEIADEVADIRTDQREHGVLIKEIHADFKLRRELEQKDHANRAINNRERITKVIGWVFSGGVLTYVLHRLGAL